MGQGSAHDRCAGGWRGGWHHLKSNCPDAALPWAQPCTRRAQPCTRNRAHSTGPALHTRSSTLRSRVRARARARACAHLMNIDSSRPSVIVLPMPRNMYWTTTTSSDCMQGLQSAALFHCDQREILYCCLAVRNQPASPGCAWTAPPCAVAHRASGAREGRLSADARVGEDVETACTATACTHKSCAVALHAADC